MSSHDRVPRGPRLPSVAQAAAWLHAPLPFLEGCRSRLGPAFTIRLPGSSPFVVLASLRDVGQVMAGDSEIFLAGRARLALRSTTFLRPFGERSLLLLDGQPHGEMRRQITPAFLRIATQGYQRLMGSAVDEAIDRWPTARPFDLSAEVQALTFDAVMRAILGLDRTEQGALRRAVLDVSELEEPSALVYFSSRGRAILEQILRVSRRDRFESTIGRLERAMLHEVQRRARSGDTGGDDVLSQLLDLRQGERTTGDESVVDALKTLLLVALETTAMASTWAIFELLQREQALERLRGELAVGEEQYLEAVVYETLRLHPPVRFAPRELAVPVRIGDWDYPAGTILLASIYLAHRDPVIFADPARFDPGRILRRPTIKSEIVPFGGGARRCIGMAFALRYMRTLLSRIALRARLRLAPGVRREGAGDAPPRGLTVIRDA